MALTGVTKGGLLKGVVYARSARPPDWSGGRPTAPLRSGRYGAAAGRPHSPGGVFRTWKTRGWSTSTLTDARECAATVSIGVMCRDSRGQWKRQGSR